MSLPDLPAPYPKPSVAWYAVAWLTLAYTVSYVDRTVLNLMLTPIKASLHLSDLEASLVQGLAFAIFYTTCALPIGWLADRGSRRSIAAAGAGLWSLATACCGLANSFAGLFAARLGVGVGEASLNPAALSMIADLFAPRQRALAASVYVAAGSVGTGFAYMAGGQIIEWAQRSGLDRLPVIGAVQPWQLVFLIVGLGGGLVVFGLLSVREPERRGIRSDEAAGAAPPLLPYLRPRWTLVATHFGGFGLFSALVYAIVNWTPTLLTRTHGWSLGAIGWRMGAVSILAGVPGVLLGGITATWLRRRRGDATILGTVIGVAAMVPAAIALPMMGSGWGALAMFAPFIFFTAFPSGLSAAAVQEVFPNRLRARATALYYFLVNLIGLLIGPTAVGFVTDKVFHDESRLADAMTLVAAVLGPLSILLMAAAIPPFRRFRVE